VADTLLADKGSDASDRVIDRLNAEGKTALIGPGQNRKRMRTYRKPGFKAPSFQDGFSFYSHKSL